MLGGIDVAGAEQNGEGRHRQRDEERNVAEQRTADVDGRRDMGEDGFERGRDRFELQRDVGNGADDRDQRDGRGNRLALAVARGDEVGDRGDVLRLCEPHDPDQQAD